MLRVVTEDVYPMTYVDKEDSQVKGYAYEYLKDILNQANINHTIEVLPWSRAYKIATSEPNVLIFGLARTEPREEKFIWLKDFLTIDVYLYGLKSRRDEISRDDQNYIDSPIGVLRDDYNHKKMKEIGYSNLVTSNNIRQRGAMLLRGRIDFIVQGDTYTDLVDERNGLVEGSLYKVKKLPELNVSIYFALNNESEPKLTERIIKAITTLDNDPNYIRPTFENSYNK